MSPFGAIARLVGATKVSGPSPATPFPERHHDLSFRVELEDLVSIPVLSVRIGRPDEALAIDEQAVSQHEQPFAPALAASPAGRIELEQRRIGTANRDDVALSIEVKADDLPGELLGRALGPLHPGRKLDPVLGRAVRVRLRVWMVPPFPAGSRPPAPPSVTPATTASNATTKMTLSLSLLLSIPVMLPVLLGDRIHEHVQRLIRRTIQALILRQSFRVILSPD